MRSKKQLLLLFLLLLSVGVIGFVMHKASHQLETFSFNIPVAHAEDDDDEKHDEDDEDEDEDKDEFSNSDYTYTIPGQTITSYVLRDVTLPDSDFDGLSDNKDPHPAIAEIYIVEDVDQDGIVDQFDLP